ncbi:MAG: aminotransferase class V-fold PLP-dependent enzyme [Christensenellaceae bacterium]
MGLIYFDNAATSKNKPEEVYDAFNYYMREIGTSPGRGSYKLGVQASRMLYQARETVASFFGISDSSCVYFSKSSTESINLFFNGYLSAGDHVIMSCYEHNAVLRPIHTLSISDGIKYSIISEKDLYANDLNELDKYIMPNTKVVALTLASNLTGQIVFRPALGEYFKSKGIVVFVDASQGGGKQLINMNSDDIDYLAFTGHKDLLGLPGSGGLCCKSELRVPPLIQGGTGVFGDLYSNPKIYPEAYEAGTLNMPAIWALKAGMDYIVDNKLKIHRCETLLMEKLLVGLSRLPNVIIYNETKQRVPTICFNIKNMKSSEVVQLLDKNDICARGGIHCAILAHQALDTVEIGAVRISLNFFNTLDEVDYFLSRIREIR